MLQSRLILILTSQRSYVYLHHLSIYRLRRFQTECDSHVQVRVYFENSSQLGSRIERSKRRLLMVNRFQYYLEFVVPQYTIVQYVQETGTVYFTDDAVAFPLRQGYQCSQISVFVVRWLDSIIPLLVKYKSLASLCSWTGRFEYYLVANPEDSFFSWRGLISSGIFLK